MRRTLPVRGSAARRSTTVVDTETRRHASSATGSAISSTVSSLAEFTEES